MKKRIFGFRKLVKRTENIIFSLLFVSFRLNFPSNENVRKEILSANVDFCINMKFLYTITVRKDEIFCRIAAKTSNFSLVLSKKMKFLHRIAAKTSHWSTFH